MTTLGSPITPDFIDHPWSSLASAQLVDGFVELRWHDGFEFRAYSLWLRENAPSIGIDPMVREGLIDPLDLGEASALLSATVSADGALELHWKDVGATRIHPGWLRQVADGRLSAMSDMPPIEPWRADIIDPPTLDGAMFIEHEDVQRAWLEHLVRFGICRLTGAPTTEGFLRELAASVGPIRASNFGDLFHVRSNPEPDSTAYTGLNLGQHTDLPTRETPPGYQLLHCIRNTARGGSARLTDGWAVVEALKVEAPEALELLTRESWVFMNRAADAEHRWEGPIIEMPLAGRPLTLRAFYPVRTAPRMAQELVPAAYEALKRFSRYAHDPRFQITFDYRPGDLVSFDNRRILHGRDAFDSSTGSRHLVGCYVDRDDVLSRLRVLNRGGVSDPHE